jgi:hypothetical protein
LINVPVMERSVQVVLAKGQRTVRAIFNQPVVPAAPVAKPPSGAVTTRAPTPTRGQVQAAMRRANREVNTEETEKETLWRYSQSSVVLVGGLGVAYWAAYDILWTPMDKFHATHRR